MLFVDLGIARSDSPPVGRPADTAAGSGDSQANRHSGTSTQIRPYDAHAALWFVVALSGNLSEITQVNMTEKR